MTTRKFGFTTRQLHSATNADPATAAVTCAASRVMRGYVDIAETVPGTGTPPTDLYDIVLADANGVIALDARIRVAPAPSGGSPLAIAPYPRELAGTANDGPALEKAVNKVHAKYEALSKIFE